MTVEVVLKYLNSPSNSSSNDSATLQQIRDRAAATAVAANKDKFELPEVLASPFHAKEVLYSFWYDGYSFDGFLQDLGSEVAHFVMTLDPRTPDVLDPFAHGGGGVVVLVLGVCLLSFIHEMQESPLSWWRVIFCSYQQDGGIRYHRMRGSILPLTIGGVLQAGEDCFSWNK